MTVTSTVILLAATIIAAAVLLVGIVLTYEAIRVALDLVNGLERAREDALDLSVDSDEE